MIPPLLISKLIVVTFFFIFDISHALNADNADPHGRIQVLSSHLSKHPEQNEETSSEAQFRVNNTIEILLSLAKDWSQSSNVEVQENAKLLLHELKENKQVHEQWAHEMKCEPPEWDPSWNFEGSSSAFIPETKEKSKLS